jgi:Flp pilus assembly protein TadG
MKHFNRERGQSLVELAVSMLVLLYLLCGAVEFGLAFFQYVQLRDAAQEGALFGSMDPASPSIIARVQGSSSSPVDLAVTSGPQAVTIGVQIDGAAVATAVANHTACEGHALTVTVSYNHTVFMPFMSKFLGPTIPLNAVVTDTILSPTCPSP